MVFTNMLKL